MGGNRWEHDLAKCCVLFAQSVKLFLSLFFSVGEERHIQKWLFGSKYQPQVGGFNQQWLWLKTDWQVIWKMGNPWPTHPGLPGFTKNLFFLLFLTITMGLNQELRAIHIAFNEQNEDLCENGHTCGSSPAKWWLSPQQIRIVGRYCMLSYGSQVDTRVSKKSPVPRGLSRYSTWCSLTRF